MKIELSRKNLKISPSVTMTIDAKAKQMQADRLNVISFGVGEPDFNTPQNIISAAVEAMEKGFTRYAAASGLPQLKNIICKKLKIDNNLSYNPEDIVISNGAKHSLYNVMQAVCNPQDEVIIPVPYWVTYPELVRMADGVSVFVYCTEENAFKMKKEDFAAAITPKTKAVFLNSPSNPAGSVYTLRELEEIAEIAVKHNILVIADEIYEKLVYDGEKHISIASLGEEIKDLTVVVNGMSKAYAMTGWRIGYTASDTKIAEVMGNIQSHATSSPNTIAQYASIEGLSGDQSFIEEMRLAFDERRKYMVKRINKINNLSCIAPKGAFYVVMNISKWFGKELKGNKIENSLQFSELLLEHAHVAIVPGIAFGVDYIVRLSYATSLDNIKEGLDRMEAFLSR